MAQTVKKKGGNTYYLSSGAPSDGEPLPTVAFVATIADRNAIDETEGFVFVRDARGDATVNRGWAVYIQDKETKTWCKVAEEESVNGLWSVRNEILKTVVRKTELNTIIRKINEKIETGLKPSGKKIDPIDLEDWTEGDLVTKINIIIDTLNEMNTTTT